MTASMTDRVVVGRQSVHDRELAVAGYELVFTTLDPYSEASAAAAEEAITSSALLGADGISLKDMVGDKRVFIDADRAMLTTDMAMALPQGTVIEVDASQRVDEEVLAGCQRLAERGFTIALDDFVWTPDAERQLQVASMVKVDAHRALEPAYATLPEFCRKFDASMVATNVETEHQLSELRQMAYDLFQGRGLQDVTSGAGTAASSASIGRLQKASSVLGQMLDFDEIEDILRPEPQLTLQILKLASMGRMGETKRKIGSVREALVAVGSWRVQNWIAMLYANPSGSGMDDRVFSSLIRASACEIVARNTAGRATARIAFAAGMLSAFRNLFQHGSDELNELALTDELREAAFGDSTPLGKIVCDVGDYQSGTRFPRMLSGVTRADLDIAFASAFLWAIEATATLA